MLSLLKWPSGLDYPTSVWVVEDQSGNNQSASPQLATKEVARLRQYEYLLNHLIPCGDAVEQSLFSRDVCGLIKGLEEQSHVGESDKSKYQCGMNVSDTCESASLHAVLQASLLALIAAINQSINLPKQDD